MAALADVWAPEVKVTVMQPLCEMAFSVPVKDYLLLSMFSVFCFCPLGIPAIVLSCLARKANTLDDKVRAKINSKLALGFSLMAILLGLLMHLFIFMTPDNSECLEEP